MSCMTDQMTDHNAVGRPLPPHDARKYAALMICVILHCNIPLIYMAMVTSGWEGVYKTGHTRQRACHVILHLRCLTGILIIDNVTKVGRSPPAPILKWTIIISIWGLLSPYCGDNSLLWRQLRMPIHSRHYREEMNQSIAFP